MVSWLAEGAWRPPKPPRTNLLFTVDHSDPGQSDLMFRRERLSIEGLFSPVALFMVFLFFYSAIHGLAGKGYDKDQIEAQNHAKKEGE